MVSLIIICLYELLFLTYSFCQTNIWTKSRLTKLNRLVYVNWKVISIKKFHLLHSNDCNFNRISIFKYIYCDFWFMYDMFAIFQTITIFIVYSYLVLTPSYSFLSRTIYSMIIIREKHVFEKSWDFIAVWFIPC